MIIATAMAVTMHPSVEAFPMQVQPHCYRSTILSTQQTSCCKIQERSWYPSFTTRISKSTTTCRPMALKTDDTYEPQLLEKLSLERTAPSQQQSLLVNGQDTTTNASQDTLVVQTTTPADPEKLVMLTLLWCVALLSALDRVAMSVAILPMSQEFGFTDTIKGSISSFFSVGYGLAILPAGLLIAQASPRVVMAYGLALWSIATLLTPFVTGWEWMLPLLLVRALVGAAESVVLPTIQRLLSTWTQPDEKSMVLALMFSGFQTGTICAYWLSPWVMDVTGGWRGLFVTYGAVGLLALLPWLALARDAPTLPTAIETVVSLPTAASASQPLPDVTTAWQTSLHTIQQAPWKDFAQSPGTWAMLLAHAAKNWGLYNQLAWTPTFYHEQYDISVRESAFLSIVPSIAAVVGGLVAGTSADALIRHMAGSSNDSMKPRIPNDTLTRIRKGFQCLGMGGSALTLGILAWHIPGEPWVAQALLTITVGLSAFNAAGFEAGIQEKASSKWAGLLYSVTSLPGVLVGTAGVYVTGQILDATQQDWSVVFGLNAMIYVVGALAFTALYDSKREFD
jgi:MFS transporter, ACS family, solute carrier family 17 (sodium-dependent inorganic phosphate cotransporter), other